MLEKYEVTDKTARDALIEATSIRSEFESLLTRRTEMPAAGIEEKLEKMQVSKLLYVVLEAYGSKQANI